MSSATWCEWEREGRDLKHPKEIDWTNPDLSSSEKVHAFAQAVEESGQRAVAKAIAEHKALGNPIYFCDRDAPEILIKEMADGHRYRVVLAEDGSETVVGEAA